MSTIPVSVTVLAYVIPPADVRKLLLLASLLLAMALALFWLRVQLQKPPAVSREDEAVPKKHSNGEH